MTTIDHPHSYTRNPTLTSGANDSFSPKPEVPEYPYSIEASDPDQPMTEGDITDDY